MNKNALTEIKFKYILATIALVIIALKLSISTLGYNTDMEIWKQVSIGMNEGFLKGRSVYTYTHFYNHGPIRSYALYILGSLLNYFNIQDMYSFHFVIVFFSSISDMITGFLLWKMFGKIPAIIFLLNPVSILITGFHSQIGNTVIMLGLISWWVFIQAIDLYKCNNQKYKKYLYISSIILGISLGIKHILIFFPIYILLIHFRYKLFSKKDIIIYSIVPYLIFFGLFGIEILRDSYHPMSVTFRNIKMFVFEYRAGGLYGTSGFSELIKFLIPVQYIEKYLTKIPIFGGYTFFFVTSLITYGILITNKLNKVKYVFPLYLLAMFAFSPSIADQYLAVPLVAVSIFYKQLISLIYFIFTFAYLAIGPSANISDLIKYNFELSVFGTQIPFFPWGFPISVETKTIQIWIILLSIFLLLKVYNTSIQTKIKKITKNYLQ